MRVRYIIHALCRGLAEQNHQCMKKLTIYASSARTLSILPWIPRTVYSTRNSAHYDVTVSYHCHIMTVWRYCIMTSPYCEISISVIRLYFNKNHWNRSGPKATGNNLWNFQNLFEVIQDTNNFQTHITRFVAPIRRTPINLDFIYFRFIYNSLI